jgi:methylated-DNA-protein-cysteine methyltransferase-like protein
MKPVLQSTKPDGSKPLGPSPTTRIEARIASIPRGRVASYGQIADLAGVPGRARLVARVLRLTESELPWHRVLRSDGCIAFPAGSDSALEQCQRLRSEGVTVNVSAGAARVDLRLHGWQPLADLIARDLLGLCDED